MANTDGGEAHLLVMSHFPGQKYFQNPAFHFLPLAQAANTRPNGDPESYNKNTKQQDSLIPIWLILL